MARLWNKDLLLSANTDAFNQRMNEMRYNAASENRKQWADAIGSVASSLGDIGKAAYEDYQSDQRYKSIDDADAEYKNDPVWIAAKKEYAKTGDSSKLNAVKTQFIAQKQAEATKAQVEEERKRRLAVANETLTGLKRQIEETPDLTSGEKLKLLTQYDTKAVEAGLPKYSKETPVVPKPAAPVVPNVNPSAPKQTAEEYMDLMGAGLDPNLLRQMNGGYLDAPATTEPQGDEPKPLTNSEIENIINSGTDQNGDGKFDSADIQKLIDAVNNAKTNAKTNTETVEADNTNILAKLNTEKKLMEKQEKDAIATGLKNTKETLSSEKPTDTSYANLANIRAWNTKVDEFNKSLGDNAAAVGTIAKIVEPKKPLPSASKQDVINWANAKFAKKIAKDKDFVSNRWNDVVDTYNANHQDKPYRGK